MTKYNKTIHISKVNGDIENTLAIIVYMPHAHKRLCTCKTCMCDLIFDFSMITYLLNHGVNV